ncbi:hypothetical protein ISF_01142 [Cordyceps fumosorosea ARSEF 2679]|uniref:Uncharacterized protein n=1 Tax=Cordyceps fumosorosea (strain ARSEF 2679) TaxID=1081104 RepID=A0A168EUI6_CORFA|nr:hypothetical protein ISF_01142 [Cordyceps fumosorosea ARSEF 2679]OAA74241.1 hypothetical protein ISF_01142 [Cordyceps fumosorosea ARSEF 2679]
MIAQQDRDETRQTKTRSGAAAAAQHSAARGVDDQSEEPVDVEDPDTFSYAHIAAVGKTLAYTASLAGKRSLDAFIARLCQVDLVANFQANSLFSYASRQIPASSHTILSSTQSEALIPITSSTTGAAAGKAIIPIKAVGFVAGITSAAGALIAIGLFIFFWRRRRAAAAAAAGGREGE